MDTRVLFATIASTITTAIGLVPLIQRRDRLTVFFASFNLSLSLWCFAVIVPFLPLPEGLRLAIFRVLFSAGVFTGLSFYLFIFEFLHIPLSQHKHIWRGLCLVGFLLICLTFTPHIIAGVDLTANPFRDIPGAAMPILLAYLAFAIGFPLIKAFQVYRQSRGLLRTQIAYVFFAMLFISAELLAYASTMYYKNLPPHYYFFQILYSLTLTYAMARHRLIDIGVMLRYAALYFVFALFLTPPFSLVLYLSHHRETAVFLLFLTLFAAPLIERKFFETFRDLLSKSPPRQGDHQFPDQILGVKNKLAFSPSVKRWAIHLSESINRQVEVDTLTVFVYNGETKKFSPVAGMRSDLPRMDLVCPAADDPLITFLSSIQGSLGLRDVKANDPERAVDILTSMRLIQSELCIPFFNGTTLLGFFSLGKKIIPGENPFVSANIKISAFQNLLEIDPTPTPGSVYIIGLLRREVGVPFPNDPSTATPQAVAEALNRLVLRTGWAGKTPRLNQISFRAQAVELRDRLQDSMPLSHNEEKKLNRAILELFFQRELTLNHRTEAYHGDDLQNLEFLIRGAESSLVGILLTLAEEFKIGEDARGLKTFVSSCLHTLEPMLAGEKGPLTLPQLRLLTKLRSDAAIARVEIDRLISPGSSNETRSPSFDLGSLARSTGESFLYFASAAGVDLRLSIPEDRVLVRGDAAFFRYGILSVLLEKAFEWTSRGGKVSLEVKAETSGAVLSLRCVGATSFTDADRAELSCPPGDPQRPPVEGKEEPGSCLRGAWRAIQTVGGRWETDGLSEGNIVLHLRLPRPEGSLPSLTES